MFNHFINYLSKFLINFIVLKPFKAYLVERCGSSVWLKLFRRINEYITSRRRRGGNNNAPDIIMTTPPPNTVQIRQIGNSMDTENKTGKIKLTKLKMNWFLINIIVYFQIWLLCNVTLFCSFYTYSNSRYRSNSSE